MYIASSVFQGSVIALIAVLAALAAFQIALAAGAPLGRFAWRGEHRILPTRLRIASLASIAIYSLIAFIALDKANAVNLLPELVSRVGMWVIFAYFALSILLNSASPSRLERSAMVPASAFLAVLSLLVALG